MSKVLTFSRVFPAYHPKAGMPTYFVEKIWNVLWGHTGLHVSYKMICDLNPHIDVEILWQFWRSIDRRIEDQKVHTIRAGHRFKAGDWFKPAVWGNDVNPKSGRSGPYHSKQIRIAPDIQIPKVFDFQIKAASKELPLDYDTDIIINHRFYTPVADIIQKVASNDGLSLLDFFDWFQYPKPFDGQIICWSDQVEY